MTANNHYNPFHALMALAIGIAIFFSVVVVLSSCNPAKKLARQERKAFKHIQKAEAVAPNELAKWCAKRYNPIDSIHERIIYKPGKVVTDTLIETEIDVVRDTVFITNTRTVYIKQTDTVDLSRFQSESNKAAIDSMAIYCARQIAAKDAEIKSQGERISALRQQNKMLVWAVIILGLYTLARWLLSYFTKGRIKLP